MLSQPAAEGSVVFVADDRDDLLVFSQLASSELRLLAVRSDRQRGGIGRELAAAAYALAEEPKLEYIVLKVWEFNRRAIRSHWALGHETVSRIMEHPI